MKRRSRVIIARCGAGSRGRVVCYNEKMVGCVPNNFLMSPGFAIIYASSG